MEIGGLDKIELDNNTDKEEKSQQNNQLQVQGVNSQIVKVPRLSREEKRLLKYQKIKSKTHHKKQKLLGIQKKKWTTLSSEQKQLIKQKRKEGEEKQMEALQNGIEVYIDMEYDLLMDAREIRSLAMQAAQIVGANKDLPKPICLHLTNYTGIQKAEMEKQGAQQWHVHRHEESLEDLVSSNQTGKEFIYLSPDADEILTEIDPSKYFYIIGGFVDRVVQKYMSLNKASSLQISSCKLPIAPYMKNRVRPLNIDTVACLLSEYYICKDWKIAYEKATSRNESLITKVYKESQQQSEVKQQEQQFQS